MDFMDSRIFRSTPHVEHNAYIRWVEKVEKKKEIFGDKKGSST